VDEEINSILTASLFQFKCRYGRAAFESNFRENVPLQSSMRPRTEEDPSWSPIIDVEYIDIACNDGGKTSGLVIVHRTAYRPGEQVVMGRLCIPVRRGLFEVIVIAGEVGTGWRESAIIASNCRSGDENMTAERLQLLLKSYKFDDAQYDMQFPSHCLSRVRAAMAWLINVSQLTVTAKPAVPAGQEVELKQLRCRVVPPKRFIYSPNTHNPESNKQRFCRASFGGTDGVQMLVISCWYVKNSGNGMNGLRQVAMHGSRAIHESQQFDNIRVSLEEVSIKRRWFSLGKLMILAWVSCEEQGQRRQNTIGWIKESSSGIIFLVYFADTLALNSDEVRNELMDTLSSIRALSFGLRGHSA
jgi:hypothetical protein